MSQILKHALVCIIRKASLKSLFNIGAFEYSSIQGHTNNLLLTSYPLLYLPNDKSSSLSIKELPVTGRLYYKHIMIVNDDSSIVSRWSFKLIDAARVIIYDRTKFIIKATSLSLSISG